MRLSSTDSFQENIVIVDLLLVLAHFLAVTTAHRLLAVVMGQGLRFELSENRVLFLGLLLLVWVFALHEVVGQG